MDAQQLIKNLTIEELAELKAAIDEHIPTIPDGFFYVGLIVKYLGHRREEYNNSYSAQLAEYESNNGEDYLIKIYSNNPDTGLGFNYVKDKSEVPEQFTQ